MAKLETAFRPSGTAAGGEFKVLKRLGPTRATPALIKAVDEVLLAYGRAEADAATRRWRTSYAENERPGADFADLTLAYYESACRKFRPFYELDFLSAGGARTARFHGAEPFLRWLARQGRLRPRALKIYFGTPSARVQIQLQSSFTADRSFLWAVASDAQALERLTMALEAAITKETGTLGRRLRLANVWLAGTAALWLAIGTAFYGRAKPWHATLAAAAAVDVAAALALFYFSRLVFPNATFALGPRSRGRRLAGRAGQALYVVALAAAFAGGAVLIFNVFFHLAW